MLTACSGDASNGQGNGQNGMPPSPVTIAEVQTESAIYTAQYPARVRGAREVEVRAQVGGILQQRNFHEGHAVSQGDTLFQIDPRTVSIGCECGTSRACRRHCYAPASGSRMATRVWFV